jgi:hypothetical protein
MTSTERAVAVELEMNLQIKTVQYAIWHSCTNCEHWSNNSAERKQEQSEEVCHLYGKIRPPAETIVVGCQSWSEIVPF